ncbi:hypothetical protein [Nocardiopsis alba]|uniref:hypothetical protein n=1 Tax=Nocardiopsis alba TaxID=53437 RepID=UPI00339E34AD
MNTEDPRVHWKTSLTMGAVMVTSMLAIIIPLGALTEWSSWVIGAVAGGVGGMLGPVATRWIMARRERIQATSSEEIDE